MTAINAKSTKAQLLQHIDDLEASHYAISVALLKAQPVPLQERVAALVNEVVALVEDTYRLGAWCRKGFDRVLTEFKACA